MSTHEYMWVNVLVRVCRSFLLTASIFSVKQERSTLPEREVEGGGVECLKGEENCETVI